MRVIKFCIFLQLFISANLFSQLKQHDFTIATTDHKLPLSYYKYIHLVDLRQDTTNMGFGIIKDGIGLVVPKISLQDQVQTLLYYCADSMLNGELILQIRKMKFAQRSKKTDDNGYFFLRANLFAKEKESYRHVASIDTLHVTASKNEQKLFSDAGKIITTFVSNNVSKVAPVLNNKKSFFEIMKIDSIEKSKLILYTTNKYTDGIYESFSSFKNQLPDHKLGRLIFGDAGIKKIKKMDIDGKERLVDNEGVYAVIENGNIYISAEFGFCNVKKFNNDFYFKTIAEVPTNEEEIILAALPFGAVSSLIAAKKAQKIYVRTKIDHVDGTFMRTSLIN